MKRRIVALFCVAAMTTVCVTGCGDSAFSSNGQEQNQQQGTSTGTSAEAESDSQGENSSGSLEMIETSEPFTMFFSGDIMLKDTTLYNYDSQGVSGVLSDDLIAEMQNADLCMINQEFPFGVGGTQAPDKQYTFKVDPKYTSVFLDMGVDIVSLANNHTLDFGQDVLSQTFVALDEAGIAYVGAGETIERAKAWETYDIKGTKVAVLSASRVIPVVDWNIYNAQPGVFCTYDPNPLIEQIALAEEEHDLTVVYVHWGVEREPYPEEYQRTMAQQYIDAGADLVIGSHPHVIQGVEYYKDVPIVYSLGNYIFNNSNKPTAALKVYVDELQNLRIQMIPVHSSGFKTYATEGQDRADMIAYIEELSYALSLDEDGYVCPIRVCDGETDGFYEEDEEDATDNQ